MDERRKNELRIETEDADDTGLIAGQEEVAQAQTMLPLLRQQAALPHEDLHAALPDGHEAHQTIDDLHAEIHKSSPNPQSIERHLSTLRALPELEAIIANWWDNPKTQRFFGILGQIGA